MQSLHVHFWHHCDPQSWLHNIKGHTLQERTGFPLEVFTLGKTSRHKHKSPTYFFHQITKYFKLEQGLTSFTTNFALTFLERASRQWVVGSLSAAPQQINGSCRNNCQADQTWDQKWEPVGSNERCDSWEAVGMAAMCVAGDFTSTEVTRVQTGSHGHCTRRSNPGTQHPVCWNLPAREVLAALKTSPWQMVTR